MGKETINCNQAGTRLRMKDQECLRGGLVAYYVKWLKLRKPWKRNDGLSVLVQKMYKNYKFKEIEICICKISIPGGNGRMGKTLIKRLLKMKNWIRKFLLSSKWKRKGLDLGTVGPLHRQNLTDNLWVYLKTLM